MGKVILDQLMKDNPKTPYSELAVCADAIRRYCEAEKNISENGAIVAHPRTGSPIDNPYLKVQDSSARQILSCKRVSDTEKAWLIARELNQVQHG